MGGAVFINYRGTDSGSYGALLFAELSRHFGRELAFLDTESIPAGTDYVQELLARVRQARVVLAVIGPRWLQTTDSEGRRIDDPNDWIRRELVEALAAGVRVIPVLTDGAELPAEGELPSDLAALARCQFRRLRYRDAGRDVDRLVADLIEMDPDLGVVARRRRGVPRQLPAVTTGFTGRVRELDLLGQALASATGVQAGSGRAGVVVISAIAGTAGIGKTTLAVHWARSVMDWFPDGQLFVNLRGFDPTGQVMDPTQAVRGFLGALGVAPQSVPAEAEAQVTLYRSLMAERRMLVVLDNARDAAHVRPLLPGAAGCLVVVTSRNTLSGLAATDGARPVSLDLLTVAEARELLANRLGPDRTAAESDAVDEIITRCARLPLALAVVAARAAANPRFSLQAIAGELATDTSRLDALDGGDPLSDVRTVFSWSYRSLSSNAARLFQLLGVHPGPDISTPAAASLAGLPLPTVRRQLAELTRANLIGEHVPGRYAFHDLLRAYAAEQAESTDQEDRHASRYRMLDHYLHTADTAARLLNPAWWPLYIPPPPHPGATPERLLDHHQAMTWFTAERPVLLAVIEHAAQTGMDTHTCQLAWALQEFLYRQGHWQERLLITGTALEAARRLGDLTMEARGHRQVARAQIQLGHHHEAHGHLRRALEINLETADLDGQAITHQVLAQLWGRQDRPDDGLHHARQALQLWRATGDQSGQADCLGITGWLLCTLGDYQQAITSCQQAITLYEQIGDRNGLAETYETLGTVHQRLGRHTEAITHYQLAIDLNRSVDNQHGQANALISLGETHYSSGNHEAAHAAWQHALTILDRFDYNPHADQLRARLHPPHNTDRLSRLSSTQPNEHES
jgi:tetratricopeptide (TPR) repeat protein